MNEPRALDKYFLMKNSRPIFSVYIPTLRVWAMLNPGINPKTHIKLGIPSVETTKCRMKNGSYAMTNIIFTLCDLVCRGIKVEVINECWLYRRQKQRQLSVTIGLVPEVASIHIGPRGLHVPPEVAFVMAIVITNFQFFFSSFAFDPLRGISQGWKFISPQYFGIRR